MRALTGFLLLCGLFACNGESSDKDTDTWVDLDDDGYSDAEDCDDNDPDVNPGKAETCDEKDNDCDDSVDENVTRTFYTDADLDGYGDANSTAAACEQTEGLASNSADCNDEDADAYPGNTEVCDDTDNDCDDVTDEGVTDSFFVDADGDGYGDAEQPIEGCEVGDGIVDNDEDCDDEDELVSPEADELCDAIDNDCDGETDEDSALDARTWYEDSDDDGYGNASEVALGCEEPDGYVSNDNDCDDDHDDAYPDAPEYCDGYDNDCDDDADESGAVDVPTWYIDTDLDGFGTDDSTLESCTSPGSGWAETDDDCDDEDDDINPDADELCDEADNDCDGDTDESGATDATTWYIDGDSDGYGNSSVSTNSCETLSGYVTDNTDCDDSDADTYPSADEYCDSSDNDCDSTTDEDALDATTWYADSDRDTYGDSSSSVDSCTQPTNYVSDSTDCDDSDATVKPGATEYCDGVDEDCDSSTDEDPYDGITYYEDADGDGYGTSTSTTKECSQPSGYETNSQDCDDTDAEINPDTVWYYDADQDGYGDPNNTRTQCSQPGTWWTRTGEDCSPYDSGSNPDETEVCFDSADNDCDGTADEDCPTEHCGYITSDETWSASEEHTVTCDVYVCNTGNPTLTVEDGVTVEFQDSSELYIGTCGPGSLEVEGTTSVVFTSDDGSNATAGDWGGVYLGYYDSGSTLDGLTVEFGGSDGHGGVYLYYADAEISNSIIQYNENYGVNSYYSNLLMTDTQVLDNELSGVYIQSNSTLETSGGPTFMGNEISGNGGYPLIVPANYVGQLDASSTYTGNDDDYVYVLADTVDDDAEWQALDVPYYINGTVYVQGSSKPELTIEGGSELYFGSGINFYVGNSSYGSIWADGSVSSILFSTIESSPSEGDWDGVNLGYYDQGSVLEGVTIEYAGANGYGNLYCYYCSLDLIDSTLQYSSTNGIYLNNARPYITGTRFADNDDDGVYISSNGGLDTSSTPGFEDNTITDNGGYPIRIPANYVGELDSSSSFSGNGDDLIYIHADTVDSDATWQYQDADYYISGQIYIQGSGRPEVEVEAGSTFYMNYSTDFYVGNSSYGALYTNGTAASPVTFTSIRSTPRAGDWDGITLGYYDMGSELTYTTVEYGGGNGYGNIYTYYADPDITSCTLSNSTVHGMYVNSQSFPLVTGTDFLDNDNTGLYITSGAGLDTSSTPGFENNTMDGNGDYPVVVPANYLGELDGTSSFTGNGEDVVYVLGDTVDADADWQELGVPYLFVGSVYIQGSSRPVVSIAEGNELQFEYGVEFFVGNSSYGGVEVNGTSGNEVTFTSAQSSPGSGDWRGIRAGYYCVANSTYFGNTIVEYGGANGAGNIYFYYCDGTVESSDITDSSSYGIYRNGSSPTLSNVSYSNNSSGNLY